MPRRALLAALALVACGPPLKPEEAKKKVEEAFAEANPSGRTGIEIRGKAVWFEAPYFEDACLEEHDLAFNDDPASRPTSVGKRISPTYQAQRWITASTPSGYCIYLGSDPGIDVDLAGIEWAGDRYKVPAKVTMGSPSPWFQCLDAAIREPVVQLLVDQDGNTSIEGDISLRQGACPSPLPGGEDRTPRARPTDKPPKPPTRDQVIALEKQLDDAFYTLDFEKVRDLSICYNLFEKDRVGTCSVGEFVALGQSFKGEQRPQDGLPWMEYTIRKPEDIGRIVRDRKDPTMYHVMMKRKRDGRDRSFAVQWVDGRWKMVAVVGLKAEGLTHARYVYDLHRPDRRDVFERRLAGEELDEHGNPPPKDPWEEE